MGFSWERRVPGTRASYRLVIFGPTYTTYSGS